MGCSKNGNGLDRNNGLEQKRTGIRIGEKGNGLK